MQSPIPLLRRLAWPSPLSGPVSQRQAAVARMEGEDAAITGLTRSLHRRLLGLNLRQREPVPTLEMAADECEAA